MSAHPDAEGFEGGGRGAREKKERGDKVCLDLC